MESSDALQEPDLIVSVRKGSLAEVEKLLVDGWDPSFQDEVDGKSALMVAAEIGNVDLVNKLLEYGAPWNALDKKGLSAGDYAMLNSHQIVLDALIDAGVRAELILGAADRALLGEKSKSENNYLQERVNYTEGNLVDNENKGVMMKWEKPLMESHAHAICYEGSDVLNIGFGLGLVDESLQQRKPSSHTIIEAHPDVHKRMLEEGWDKKPGVKIIFGRWQDVIPQLETYDGIFFDTYGEYYDDLREFHQHLPTLLRQTGTYSFFNGLCGDNAFFHVVCCNMVALELAHLGLSTEFIQLPVKACIDETTWEKISHKYWQLDTYYLPVCQFATTNEVD